MTPLREDLEENLGISFAKQQVFAPMQTAGISSAKAQCCALFSITKSKVVCNRV
jgi:hypothetical protein